MLSEQPVYCPTALENITEFNEFDRPSEQFLRFGKDYFSNGKADKQNNPSFRSCLVRIPGSYRSKYGTKVTIVQKWNGVRAPITRDFLEEFRIWLIQKKIDQENQRQKILEERSKNKNKFVGSSNYYRYIELLLQTPIENFRKWVLWQILCPYLVNIRKLSENDSFQILKEWLNKCNSLRKLDFNPNQKIRDELKHVENYFPLGVPRLKTDKEYSDLYQILKNK